MQLAHGKLRTFQFDHEPSFAELWEVTIETIFDRRCFVQELERLLEDHGITRSSNILDTCTGGGFPAIDLIRDGYTVDAMDAAPDMVELYDRHAAQLGLQSRCVLAYWEEIPERFAGRRYDLILCRGNSFRFAAGGWNEPRKSFSSPDEAFRRTLAIFRNALRPGGSLYLDLSRDTADHRETICRIEVAGRREELVFLIEYEGTVRHASLVRVAEDGSELRLRKSSLVLTAAHLEDLLRSAGFEIEAVTLPSESQLFQGWLAKV